MRKDKLSYAIHHTNFSHFVFPSLASGAERETFSYLAGSSGVDEP
jgi:hypothetical protein